MVNDRVDVYVEVLATVVVDLVMVVADRLVVVESIGVVVGLLVLLIVLLEAADVTELVLGGVVLVLELDRGD